MRIEHVEEADGLRTVTILEPKRQFPDRPVWRLRVALDAEDVLPVIARLPAEQREMALALLRQGRGRWRRWASVVRKPPKGFVPLIAELELLPLLCRAGALELREKWSHREGVWRAAAFRSEPATVAYALGEDDPESYRSALMTELSSWDLRQAIDDGPPRGFTWRAFAFVLRAAERWREYDAHDTRPRARELAGQIESTKYWTEARQRLFAELLGRPWAELVAAKPRQLRVKGPLEHPQAALWAQSILSVPLTVLPTACGMVCVENHETFDHLLPRADDGWIVLQVPGGPPPAECELLARLDALAPGLPVLAAFDPDPAGIRIAQTLAERSGVTLDARLMSPQALSRARALELTDWDREWIERLRGHAGPFEPLLASIAAAQHKGEQEPLNEWLDEQIRTMPLT